MQKGLTRIKVNGPLKMRTESVVIGCNHVLSVAEESKLSYVGSSHIPYWIFNACYSVQDTINDFLQINIHVQCFNPSKWHQIDVQQCPV